ncbi:CGNR zinc finger domain-containing protein [Peterkaempfera bronchialis]|uniref:CGNR zinc finger domain-containing protein n=1 Tax=Peterkaempfera bronchialis TaxID=2126346 RepID=UPI003C2FBDBD
MTVLTPAPGEDKSVGLAMVNTKQRGPDGVVDRLATGPEAAEWLRSHGLVAEPGVRIGEPEVVRLAELRAAIRDLFTAQADCRTPAPDSVAAVNAAAAAQPAAPQVDWADAGRPSRRWRSARPGGLEAGMAALAWDAIDVVCGEKGAMLRRCEAHGCVRIFLREHARRRWCSTTCGDRVRAARHHRAQQATAEGVHRFAD